MQLQSGKIANTEWRREAQVCGKLPPMRSPYRLWCRTSESFSASFCGCLCNLGLPKNIFRPFSISQYLLLVFLAQKKVVVLRRIFKCLSHEMKGLNKKLKNLINAIKKLIYSFALNRYDNFVVSHKRAIGFFRCFI